MRANESQSSRDDAGGVKVRWTASGVVFFCVGSLLFLVGMLRVDGVMAAMGLCAWILLLWARWIGVRNVSGMEIFFRSPRRVDAGKMFEGKLELWNRRRVMDGFRIHFGIHVMGERDFVGRVGWIGVGGFAVASERFRLKQRGLRKEHVGWVESLFPLGLMKFRSEHRVVGEVGVLPGTRVPEELRFSGFLLDGAPFGGSRQYGGMGEWRGLREWRGGDAVKRIAWAASMRGGYAGVAGRGLMVKQYEPPGSQVEKCVVVFHSLGGDKNLIRPDRFEMALTLLSGVMGYLLGTGVEVSVMADFRGWESVEISGKRQLARFREELISVKRAGWTEVHELRDVMGGLADGECLVVISDMPAASWSSLIPKRELEAVIVDIEKYGKLERRGFRYRKGAER